MSAEREAAPAILTSPIDLLLQQAGVQAGELKRKRAEIGGGSGIRAALPLKALEAELAQTWNAIRKMRSPGSTEPEGVRRRSKWR